ncbi:MAG: N-formylglutamate amidohydrolase [Planctomycetota bacterium]|jgi:N-formylglutamate amidohydrolase
MSPHDCLSDGPIWEIQFGAAPLVAAAIHDGHAVREEVASLLAVSEMDRLHEEDPHTAFWTTIAPTRIVVLRSRFEVDLNRPRDRAVYLTPGDAWDLQVWKSPPSTQVLARSLAQYDAFYRQVRVALETLVSQFGRVLVLDLHNYNHRPAGPDGPPADPAENPEVNVGTGTMDRPRWAGLVNRFIEGLGKFDFLGRSLDVRENVRFSGGQFSQWIHDTFGDSVCCLAIEVKNFFMDEWTGEVDQTQLYELGEALKAAARGALEELSDR